MMRIAKVCRPFPLFKAATISLLLGFSHQAAADLAIMVDFEAQEYFVTGSATGMPEYFNLPGTTEGRLSWSSTGGAGEATPFLAGDALLVTGNTYYWDFEGYLHAPGWVNGGMYLTNYAMTTLTGNDSLRFDYSGWSAPLRTALENKALSGAILRTQEGDSAFDMRFERVGAPEPSSLLLSLLGASTMLGLRRQRKNRALAA